MFTLTLLLLPSVGIAADFLPTEGLFEDVFLGGLPPLPPSPEEAGFLLNTQIVNQAPSGEQRKEEIEEKDTFSIPTSPTTMAHLVPLHAKNSASSAAGLSIFPSQKTISAQKKTRKTYKQRIPRSGAKYGLCHIGNCQEHCKGGNFLYKHLQSSHTKTERESIFYICATHNYATHSSGSKCYHLKTFHSTQP